MSVYKYTVRFNASHSNTSDKATAHTHSFVVSTYLRYDNHVPYDQTEEKIKACLLKYKGVYLNDALVSEATIENIADSLFQELDVLIGDNKLCSLELSDSPVQLFKIRRTD